MTYKVGQWIVIKASTALEVWDGSECPEGWVEAYQCAEVVGLENGWPVISLWGKRCAVNPALIVER